MDTTDYPKLLLPEWFDDRSEFETPFRGYLDHVEVELEDGSRYSVIFIDPTRLQQNLEGEVEMGRPYFAEAGMIVLPEVTLEKARAVIKYLAAEGFFAKLKPL
jgi:hypothetical protein